MIFILFITKPISAIPSDNNSEPDARLLKYDIETGNFKSLYDIQEIKNGFGTAFIYKDGKLYMYYENSELTDIKTNRFDYTYCILSINLDTDNCVVVYSRDYNDVLYIENFTGVFDGLMYWEGHDESGSIIYTTDLSGDNKTIINYYDYMPAVREDGYIYWTDGTNNGDDTYTRDLYRVTPHKDAKEKILDNYLSFAVAEKCIYYIVSPDSDAKEYLYRMDKDSGNIEYICETDGIFKPAFLYAAEFKGDYMAFPFMRLDLNGTVPNNNRNEIFGYFILDTDTLEHKIVH